MVKQLKLEHKGGKNGVIEEFSLEVWLIFDIDKNNSRSKQIVTVRAQCEMNNWKVAQSSPCFEVWLYYHLYQDISEITSDRCSDWKRFVGETIPGGFNSKTHPAFLRTALKNAEANFGNTDGHLNLGSTEMQNLANVLLPLIEEKLKIFLEPLK